MFSVKQVAFCIVSERDGSGYPLSWWLVPSPSAEMWKELLHSSKPQWLLGSEGKRSALSFGCCSLNSVSKPGLAGSSGDKILFVHTVRSQGCERQLLRQFSWYLAGFAWSKSEAILQWCQDSQRAGHPGASLTFKVGLRVGLKIGEPNQGELHSCWVFPCWVALLHNTLVQQPNSGLIPLPSGCWVNAAAISFHFCFLSSLLLWSAICPFGWCVQKSNSMNISLLRSPGRHSWALVQCCSWPCWWEWTICWMFNGNWVRDEWLDQIKVK